MSIARFLYHELRMMMAKTMASELTSFSLTVHICRNGQRRRIFSNFGRSSTICTVRNRLPRCRRHPDWRFWTGSKDLIGLTGNGENHRKNTIDQQEL